MNGWMDVNQRPASIHNLERNRKRTKHATYTSEYKTENTGRINIQKQ